MNESLLFVADIKDETFPHSSYTESDPVHVPKKLSCTAKTAIFRQAFKDKHQLKMKQHNNFTVAFLLFPSSFFYVMFSTVVSAMASQLARDLKCTVEMVKMLVHIENTVCLVTMSVANRFLAKYGLTQLHCIGGIVVFVTALIAGIYPNQYLFFVCRVISSIGYSISAPVYVPLSNRFSRKNPQLTIAMNNSLSSISSLLVITLKPYLIQHTWSWRFIYLIGSAIMLPYCICTLVYLPFPKPTVKVAISLFGICMMAIPNILIGSGVILTLEFMAFDHALQIGYLCVVASIVTFGVFIIQNSKAKHPIIPMPVLNPNTICFVSQILFQALSVQIDSASEGTIWEKIFDVPGASSDFFIQICKLMPVIAVPIMHFLIKYVTCRLLLCCTCVSLMFLQFIKSFSLKFWSNNYYAVIVVNLAIATVYIQALTTTQFYNVSSSPAAFGPVSTSYITYFNKLAYSLAFVIQRSIRLIGPTIYQLALYQTVAITVACVALQIAKNIGLFKFDRGKIGFLNQEMLNFITYEEMYDEFKYRYATLVRRKSLFKNKKIDIDQQILLYEEEIETVVNKMN